jgi:hypothetical protein
MEFNVGNRETKSIARPKKAVEWLKELFDNNYSSNGYVSEPKTINIVVNGNFEHCRKCPTCYTGRLEIVDVHHNTHVYLEKPTHQQVLEIILGLSMSYFIEIEYRYSKLII